MKIFKLIRIYVLAKALALLALFVVNPVKAQENLLVDSIGVELNVLAGELIAKVSDRSTRLSFDELRDAVRSAYVGSPIYKASSDRLDVAAAVVEESQARFLPQLNLTADRGRDTVGGSSDTNYSSQRLSVNQFLYDFGSSNYDHEAIRLEQKLAELAHHDDKSDLLLRLLTAYFELFRASKQLEISKAFIASREQFLDLVGKREAIGGSSRADIVRAEAKLAEALDNLPTASEGQRLATNTYLELFRGLPSRIDVHELPDTTFSEEAQVLGKYLETSVAMRRARLQVAVSESRLESVQTQRYGKLDLLASYGRGGGVSNVGSSQTETSARVQYSVNIFSGFSQQARISQSAIRLDEAKQNVAAVELAEVRSIKDALYKLRTMEALVDSRVGLVRRAKSASDITRELFVLNRGSIADIFRAQEDYISATRNLLNAIVDRMIAYYQLARTLHVLPELMGVKG